MLLSVEPPWHTTCDCPSAVSGYRIRSWPGAYRPLPCHASRRIFELIATALKFEQKVEFVGRGKSCRDTTNIVPLTQNLLAIDDISNPSILAICKPGTATCKPVPQWNGPRRLGGEAPGGYVNDSPPAPQHQN